MCSWVRQFKEGRESCDNESKKPRPRTSQFDNMIARMEKLVLEGRRFTWSKQTPKEAFAAAMASWRRLYEKYLRLKGDYVEK
ncbi:hypothetical protein ANN_09220 [Periplaneta americana]|uniref:Transposase n=1 Tax=Periplaneta americana TaxID=6978 RepID=A0ABQ8TLP4_PERAM|nr:hypothetical protein ANN_09220 [Periplaneta americana]